MAGHSEGMWLSDKEYHVLRKILEMAHLKENEGEGMTHHRAIIISPNSVETIEIGGNAEKAESYEMWVRSNYTVIDIKTFGDINGADYVVMYYVKGRISK